MMASQAMYGELAVQESIPVPENGEGRSSPLRNAVEAIRANPDKHGMAICIAAYNDKATAAANANNLKSRYGNRVDIGGFEFASRKVNLSGEDKHGVWVYYDPSKMVPGLWDSFDEQARAKRKEANKRANERAKAKVAEKKVTKAKAAAK
jgi:hypothetical protein